MDHWILCQPDQVSKTDTMAKETEVLFMATSDLLSHALTVSLYLFLSTSVSLGVDLEAVPCTGQCVQISICTYNIRMHSIYLS